MEAVFIVLALVLGIIVVVISLRNSIVRGKNQVKRSWADVLVHVQKKMKIIPKLSEEVKSHQEYEQGTLKAIVSLRAAANAVTPDATPAQVEQAESAFDQGIKNLKVAVEAYPDLKTSSLYQSLMSEIVEQQEDISAGITIYNRNVEHFNNLIQEFPGSLINSWFNNEKEIESFNVEEGVNEEVGFKPNL